MASVGQEEFGAGLDSGAFLAHLEADEAAVQEANKLLLVSTECVARTVHVHVYSSNITVLSLYVEIYIYIYTCIYSGIITVYDFIYRCIYMYYLCIFIGVYMYLYNVFILLSFCFVQPASFTASSPHTPSFTHLLPSSSSSSSSHPTTLPHQSGEKDLSIGTYFGQRSYKLGALQTSGAAPSERVSPPIMYMYTS